MTHLDFVNIKNNEKCNKEVLELYKESFPKYEMIPFLLLKIMTRKNKAKFYGIYDNSKFVGLIYNIFLWGIVYISYFY